VWWRGCGVYYEGSQHIVDEERQVYMFSQCTEEMAACDGGE